MLFYGFIVSITLNLIVLLVLFVLLLKQRGLNKRLSMLGKKAAEGKLPHIINQSYKKINELEGELDNLNKYYSKLFHHADATLQNVGLIRYDAFEDTGGNLSFSLALLNNQKDGFVLTSITGRSENRLYVKQIIAGQSNDMQLTTEEIRSVQKAMQTSRKMYSDKKKVTSKS